MLSLLRSWSKAVGTGLLLVALCLLGSSVCLAGHETTHSKPHAVFVVGTHHYSPHITMPPLAEQVAEAGFRTTIVMANKDPEHDAAGLPWLEVLKDADVAIFYMRFLTLPTEQLKIIEDYLAAGKPVVAFRTSSHAFDYPKDSPLAEWNNGFGRRAMGTKYIAHLNSKTQVQITDNSNPIIKHSALPKETTAGGKLYLVDLPSDANVLLTGTSESKRTGQITNRFGTHTRTKKMTEPVAWTWKNEWGGRVFGSTLGHIQTFRDPQFVRLLTNGICWAAGKPMLPADTQVGSIQNGKLVQVAQAKKPRKSKRPKKTRVADAKNTKSGKSAPPEDPEYAKYAIFEKTAARPDPAKESPSKTVLPLKLERGDTIAFIGNTQLDRTRHFGYLETAIHQAYPKHELVIRNLCWPGDTPSLQPRPMNFADLEQHLTHVKADVILASFGFNESFAGEDGLDVFRQSLTSYASALKSLAFNSETAARVVLVSPIANENIPGVPAADLNNKNIAAYVETIRKVADEQNIAFIDVFADTEKAMQSPSSTLTINGSHLNDTGYQVFADSAFRGLFGQARPKSNEQLRQAIIDKNRQFFRRYRPANTFYYTGGRNKSYGYLDFLPAMKNFDLMVANRDQRIWAMARGEKVPAKVDDTNVPLLPQTKESRGANEYLSAEEELKAFKVDPRFEVNLFAGEEQFRDLGAPIQMRWDSKGRLWVACSTTYPHVYPGNEPNDKLVILEDTDGDGKADKSSVFADDLHIPLSFEFAPGNPKRERGTAVYISEMPDLTLIEDTDGDGKADKRTRVLSGFGTEDSHHALHDITWTPDGDLIWREAIFHHTQVETPYGPVRQQNSGWFRFQPRDQRLTSFGSYHSTNPWGVTFDDWGQHVASHPIYAEAFHSLDAPYPLQHPRPTGLQAYSGTCGQEFVDFPNWPKELQGHFIKVRYKPTNRVEIHKWKEGEFGFEEEYVSDLIFSTNLSFIPVDLRYGPRGAMFICDWYNPVKGHAQYSLRDDRRDRHSGRIWRIVPKDGKLAEPPKFDGASIAELLDMMKRSEYRYRSWAKRELRARDEGEVKSALDEWVKGLDSSDPRFRHHQIEAIWNYRNIGAQNTELLRELLRCDDYHARAAAMKQLRYWHDAMEDSAELLEAGVNDENGVVRMQSAICASYIGTPEALDTVLEVFKHPQGGHLSYAVQCALGSASLRKHWEGNPNYQIARLLNQAKRSNELKEPSPSAGQAEFDTQKDVKVVRISCQPERMLFTIKQFAAKPGQPVKLVFSNPDATDHNLLIVRDGALEEVGMAANDMARDPKNANSDFIPKSKRDLIIEASPMIGPTRKSRVHVMRFKAPTEPGVYPYVCTFPGHWVVMRGDMVVADSEEEAKTILASRQATIQKEWKLADFEELKLTKDEVAKDEATMMRGMQNFMKANCHQCHAVGMHGANLGPSLADVGKRFKPRELLRHILEPSHEINEKFQTVHVLDDAGQEFSGVVQAENEATVTLMPNLLTPKKLVTIQKKAIEHRGKSKISSMPSGLVNVLKKSEIEDLLAYLLHGGYKLPDHLKKGHGH